VTLRFDHAIICVFDLAAAIEDFRGLGFNPIIGGQHAGGKTHNALIIFRDGSYLELLAPTSPALLDHLNPEDRSNFLFLFAGGEGFRGYALVSDDLGGDAAQIQARGVEVTLQPENGRARTDGVELRWRTAFLTEPSGTMTPFFLEDLTPRRLRVPDDLAVTTHPNGAIGTWEITIQTSRAPGQADFHAQLFGDTLKPAFFDPPIVRQTWAYHDLACGTRLMIRSEAVEGDARGVAPRQVIGLGLVTDQVEGGTLESRKASILLSPKGLVEQITRRGR
jgi:hypothetical protein